MKAISGFFVFFFFFFVGGAGGGGRPWKSLRLWDRMCGLFQFEWVVFKESVISFFCLLGLNFTRLSKGEAVEWLLPQRQNSFDRSGPSLVFITEQWRTVPSPLHNLARRGDFFYKTAANIKRREPAQGDTTLRCDFNQAAHGFIQDSMREVQMSALLRSRPWLSHKAVCSIDCGEAPRLKRRDGLKPSV